MNKAVAYLDILGFSNAVNNSVFDAIMCLNSFNTILSTCIRDLKVAPMSSYDPIIQDLANRMSVSSFEEFIPFSDSVFATSTDCSLFVMQLGNFALKSFMFTSHFYCYTDNLDDPTLTYTIGLKMNENGGQEIVKEPYHLPPVLFRGGLSWGEIVNLTPIALIGGNTKVIDTLAGKAVVKAVRYEQSGLKGPRLFFDKSLYAQLDERTKKYCRAIPEKDKTGLFEILWPAMGYITENAYRQEFCKFYELFDAAYNLWIPFKQNGPSDVAEHYLAFMQLIISGTTQIYKLFWDEKDYAIEEIRKHLENKKIVNLFSL